MVLHLVIDSHLQMCEARPHSMHVASDSHDPGGEKDQDGSNEIKNCLNFSEV